MSHTLGIYVLDNGLDYIYDNAVGIYICSQDPTTYAEATSTFKLGQKTFTAGTGFTACADATPNGRKVSSVAINNGSITGNGQATAWAVVDGSHLLANGGLATPQNVNNGNSFVLPSFSIRIPNQ
jgi:hypothetical protein